MSCIKLKRVTEWLLWGLAKPWLFSSWVRIPPRPKRECSITGRTFVLHTKGMGSSPIISKLKVPG